MIIDSRLETLGIKFPFWVGPMVGISHVATRRLVREYMPKNLTAMLFTEMLSTRRLPSERLHHANELKVHDEEGCFIPQLLGNDEEFIAKSLRKLSVLEPFGFDINMGCPVKHTLRHNWGVRLMGDIPYAAQVVEWTKKHATVPIGVKLRGGTESIDIDYLDRFTAALEDSGADWLTIHARASSEKHRGSADWAAVGEIRKIRKIPIFANGDIQNSDDALHIMQNAYADGAMIGRAITARPWILSQIAWHLKSLDPVLYPYVFEKNPPLTLAEESREYFSALDRFIVLLDDHFESEDYKLKKLRFFVVTGSQFFMFGHSFWKLVMKAGSLADCRKRIREYGETNSYPMKERASL